MNLLEPHSRFLVQITCNWCGLFWPHKTGLPRISLRKGTCQASKCFRSEYRYGGSEGSLWCVVGGGGARASGRAQICGECSTEGFPTEGLPTETGAMVGPTEGSPTETGATAGPTEGFPTGPVPANVECSLVGNRSVPSPPHYRERCSRASFVESTAAVPCISFVGGARVFERLAPGRTACLRAVQIGAVRVYCEVCGRSEAGRFAAAFGGKLSASSPWSALLRPAIESRFFRRKGGFCTIFSSFFRDNDSVDSHTNTKPRSARARARTTAPTHAQAPKDTHMKHPQQHKTKTRLLLLFMERRDEGVVLSLCHV